MNPIRDKPSQAFLPFVLSPAIVWPMLAEEFQNKRRLRIPNFFDPLSALALYKHLAHRVAWKAFLATNGKLLTQPSASSAENSPETERMILERAQQSASYDFAFRYDADRLFPEDVPTEAIAQLPTHDDPVLGRLCTCLNSELLLNGLRQMTGVNGISRVAIQATRYKPGFFHHYRTLPAPTSNLEAVSIAFTLTLNPEWNPEWGGLLQFWSSGPSVVEAYSPSFNVLDIYALPQGHWISPVSAFAAHDRLAITGRIYHPER